MTHLLAASWASTPWRHEAATTSAAWLAGAGDGAIDLIRADLDGHLPREEPRPPFDTRPARTVSLAGGHPGPQTWADVAAYAQAGVTRAVAWAGTGSGSGWDEGYSGPVGLADHLILALLRQRGLVTRWTAHIIDLPTHDPGGRRRDDRVTEDALLAAVRRLAPGEPAGDGVADRILGLLASADRVLAGSDALATHLSEQHGLDGIEVWERPGETQPPADRAPGIRAAVDAARLPALGPVLAAYAQLTPAEQAALPLRLLTNAPETVGPELRRRGLEARVSVGPDLCPAARSGADFALVLDAPRPDGMAWSPAGIPELADHARSGTEVILLAPQDSPLTQAAVAHHVPADHPSAMLALLRGLAARLPV